MIEVVINTQRIFFFIENRISLWNHFFKKNMVCCQPFWINIGLQAERKGQRSNRKSLLALSGAPKETDER